MTKKNLVLHMDVLKKGVLMYSRPVIKKDFELWLWRKELETWGGYTTRLIYVNYINQHTCNRCTNCVKSNKGLMTSREMAASKCLENNRYINFPVVIDINDRMFIDDSEFTKPPKREAVRMSLEDFQRWKDNSELFKVDGLFKMLWAKALEEARNSIMY